MTTSSTVKWLAALFALVIALAFIAAPAIANGAPITIFLNYLPEFSNFGPLNARGTATISIGEAWVEIAAERMPLLKGQLYEAWIVGADIGQGISLGTFNADAKGRVAYKAEFEELPPADYRYLYVSVEPDPDADPKADKRVTIAGVFPNAELLIVSNTPTPTPRPGVTPAPSAAPSPAAPDVLPVTGGGGVSGWVVLGALLLIVLTWALLSVVRGRQNCDRVPVSARRAGPPLSRADAAGHPGEDIDRGTDYRP